MSKLRNKKLKEGKNHKCETDVKEEIEEISRSLLNDFKILMNDVFKNERKAVTKTSSFCQREDSEEFEPINRKASEDRSRDSTPEEETAEHGATESDLDSQIAPTTNEYCQIHNKRSQRTRTSLHSSYDGSSDDRPKVAESYSNISAESRHSLKAEQPLQSSSESRPSSTVAPKSPKTATRKSILNKDTMPKPVKTNTVMHVRRNDPHPTDKIYTECNHRKELVKPRQSIENKADPTTKRKDKIDRFTEHLARKLRRLEPLQRILTERIIAEVCSHARRGRLTIGAMGKLAALFMTSKDVKEEERLVEVRIAKDKAKAESRHDEKKVPELTNADIDAIVRREKALLAQYVEL